MTTIERIDAMLASEEARPVLSPQAQVLLVTLKGCLQGKPIPDAATLNKTLEEASPLVLLKHVTQCVRVVLRKYWPVTEEQLFSRNRTAEVAEARMLTMHLLRLHGYTLNEVGKVFGRDHSAVVHASKEVTSRFSSATLLMLIRQANCPRATLPSSIPHS